jgi:hypothetical protein
MKRISLALLFISALLLPLGAHARSNPIPEHQIYGIRYGGGYSALRSPRFMDRTHSEQWVRNLLRPAEANK